jgi:hypothetical protein
VRFNSAFVTFATIYAKTQFYKAINISFMYKLCCFKCFRKCNKKADRHIISFEKFNIEARKPSEPVNILWTNLHIHRRIEKAQRNSIIHIDNTDCVGPSRTGDHSLCTPSKPKLP